MEKQDKKAEAPEGSVREESPGNQLQEMERQLLEFRDLLQRTQADFQNYIKRAEKEKDGERERGAAEMVQKLLSFLDSLDAAEAHARDAEKKGLQGLKKQLHGILEGAGLRGMDVMGKNFDPGCAECVGVEMDAGKEEDRVAEVVQKGYFFKEKVLRPARVKISKKGG